MYTDFDQNIKPEYIILSNLQNYKLDFHDEYYYLSGMEYEREQKNPNKSKEEIKSEINKEIKNEMLLFQKQSVKYFQINKGKNSGFNNGYYISKDYIKTIEFACDVNNKKSV